MKHILLLALSVGALGIASCSEEEPRHRTVVHHVYREGPSVGTPTGERAEDFQANTKPDRY